MERSPDTATRGASGRHGSPWRAAGIVLVALLTLAGSGLLVAGLRWQPDGPPQPPVYAAPPSLAPAPPGAAAAASPGAATAASPGAATASPGGATSPAKATSPSPPASLPRSRPTRVKVPRIGVDARIVKVGVDDQGVVEMPPLEQAQLAGWYGLGPTPGEIGNAAIVGHVDSYATGPAVFYRLGALRPGDVIEVDRADGRTARFVVDGVASYPRESFPAHLVYGPSHRAGLRLVTCGGTYDARTREYSHNVIVFATLAPESRA